MAELGSFDASSVNIRSGNSIAINSALDFPALTVSIDCNFYLRGSGAVTNEVAPSSVSLLSLI